LHHIVFVYLFLSMLCDILKNAIASLHRKNRAKMAVQLPAFLSTPASFSARHFVLTFLVVFGFFGLLLEYGHLGTHTIFPKLSRPGATNQASSWATSQFWIAFAPVLAAAAPRCPEPKLIGKAASFVRVPVPGSGAIADRSANVLNMELKDVNSMRRSHAWFLNQISHELLALEYNSGTQGIVTSAGGEYFPTLLVSLQFLRRTGSTLPVEVFLSSPEEYEEQICTKVLPALNAKCIILSNILEQSLLPFEPRHYQLKSFAMLFSSFENILFLDADNFPVHPPETLFKSDPFLSNKLVLWPDYWTPTVSPLFYTVTGMEQDILEDRPTIEAGQILVSKKHHAKTLLLAAYYNCYGEYYYHLMTQGGPGEGDKETFSSAALVLKAPFYTIQQPTSPLGNRHGGAVLQPHPTDDFQSQTNKNITVRPMFVHASWPPKLNAMRNLRQHRQWGSAENSAEKFNGLDIEPVAWGYMVEMACKEGLEFRDWGNYNKTGKDVCGQTRKSFTDMFGREYAGEEENSMWWSSLG
jgi:alpha 1,2-mannosyltransferase